MCVYHKDDARAFRDAVDSVTIRQTVCPDEVVIVVDGPVFGELNEIINELETRKDLFSIVRLPENLGHAGARRCAFEHAANDILAVMDADDIASPDRFEKQIAYLDRHSDVAVVGGQITEFLDDEGNIVGMREVPCNHDEVMKMMKSRCPMNQMTVMMRRDPVASAGGYLDWYCDEDYYLWIRLAENGYVFANLPDVLVNVRVGREMYQRRGGWPYFKSEARLQGYMLGRKIISLPRYVFNVAVRFAVQVAIPDKVRGFVFQKLFRK